MYAAGVSNGGRNLNGHRGEQRSLLVCLTLLEEAGLLGHLGIMSSLVRGVPGKGG